MLGATNGVAAAPGTVRGDFSISKQNNLVHGSDSPESAQREIALWFRPEDVVAYSLAGDEWVFSGGLIGTPNHGQGIAEEGRLRQPVLCGRSWS